MHDDYSQEDCQDCKAHYDKCKPDYYKGKFGLEAIDVIEAFDMDFAEGCALKYLLRYKDKGGVKDLKKCVYYIQRLIERGDK